MRTLKGIMLSIALLLGFVGFSAQTPDWMWAKRAGGIGYDQGMATSTDSQGNQYVAGHFTGTADFGATTLYNLRDQAISTQELAPGIHSLSLNGYELPVGIYLINLRTKSVNITRKLVLLN